MNSPRGKDIRRIGEINKKSGSYEIFVITGIAEGFIHAAHCPYSRSFRVYKTALLKKQISRKPLGNEAFRQPEFRQMFANDTVRLINEISVAENKSHIRIFAGNLQLPGEPGRITEVILINDCNPVAFCIFKGKIPGGRQTIIRPEKWSYARMTGGKCGNKRRCAICRPIINNENLKIAISLCKYALYGLLQVALTVVCTDHNANQWIGHFNLNEMGSKLHACHISTSSYIGKPCAFAGMLTNFQVLLCGMAGCFFAITA